MVKVVRNLIEERKILELNEYFQNLNPVDIAKDMIYLKDEEAVLAFRILPKDMAVEVFSYLDKEMKQNIIQLITDNEIKDIIDKLFLDDTVDFIEELPSHIVKKVLKNTSKEKRELINQFLKYDENSAGSIMTIEFLDLKESMTVKEAINYIRYECSKKEDVDTCFIIDKNRKLKGTLPLKKLILKNEDDVLENIMDINIISTKTIEDREIVASDFKKYDLTCMPVVDIENRLVGIITVDDIIDIIDQENTEDIRKNGSYASK